MAPSAFLYTKKKGRKMTGFRLLILTIAFVFSADALADSATEALGRCLSDNTTGKDRKDLAKWIFVSMSAHPEIAPIAKASNESMDAVQRSVGVLVTRLITEACPSEMGNVIKAEGQSGIRNAFEYLGRMAMQELMSNQQVNLAISGFEQYLDRAKIEAVLTAK